MTDLLPCPDCGNPPTLSVEPMHVEVSCYNCYDYCSIDGGTWHAVGASRLFGRSLAEVRREAIEIWNDAVHEHSEGPI